MELGEMEGRLLFGASFW